MGNRVENLERQVTELRAAVDGLTEELVETKERLNQLEASADAETETTDDDRREQAHVEFVPNQSPEEHTEYVGARDADASDDRQTQSGQSDQSEQSAQQSGQRRQDAAQAEARGSTRDQSTTDGSEESTDDEDGDDIIVA